ncbi:MAG: class I SAM-dependent rRNA methyltransferase [Bacteroidales bacterium]|nr:class I SAM-dependent rRNA methyltransferase [Bacteroidales bacterium]
MSIDNKTKIVLKSGKDQSLRRFHPWVFSGAIKKIYGNVAEGDVVDVFDNKDEYLATGHYQNGSIAVRVLNFDGGEIDEDFYRQKLSAAYELRKKVGLAESDHTNVFRLFHAEGDGIPGLIIDYYNGALVLQSHSIGVYRKLDVIKGLLKEILGDKLIGIYNKSESTMPKNLDFNVENGSVLGNLNQNEAKENGLTFNVRWVDGQKTGFFVDQRNNRKLLGEYARGRRVLNMFCYSGGFSVYALANEAELVHSVDSSAKAIDLVNQNVALNFPDCKNHEAYPVDAFEFMKDIKDKYNCIILDPPAFAKHQNVLNNALQGYKRLNQLAFEQIAPGGIVFTFSCSQAVSKENFRKSVFAAAANARRNVRILEQLTQPADHPVNIYHPEGEYLKGLVLYVE